MRTVDAGWSGVKAGLLRADALERTLEERWATALDRARARRTAISRQAWEARVAADCRGHEAAVHAWRQRTAAREGEYHVQRAAWLRQVAVANERLRAQRSLAVLARGVGSALAGFAAVLIATGTAVFAVSAAVLFALIASAPALAAIRSLHVLRGCEPEPLPEEPMPARPARGPALGLEPVRPVDMNLTEQWWRAVAQYGRQRPPTVHRPREKEGEEGETILVAELARSLDNGYIAVRNPLVARSLDADVVLVGPTGIWVFEVKHWTGDIECRDGRWSRTHTHRGPGGLPVTKRTEVDWEEQWQRERNAVHQTLRRRLAEGVDLDDAIGGGLVFTHPDASWDVDTSHRTGYGAPAFWSGIVRRAGPRLSDQIVIDVVDALLVWNHKLARDHNYPDPPSAFEIAEHLFDAAGAQARAYCAGGVAP